MGFFCTVIGNFTGKGQSPVPEVIFQFFECTKICAIIPEKVWWTRCLGWPQEGAKGQFISCEISLSVFTHNINSRQAPLCGHPRFRYRHFNSQFFLKKISKPKDILQLKKTAKKLSPRRANKIGSHFWLPKFLISNRQKQNRPLFIYFLGVF